MAPDLKYFISHCLECQQYKASNVAPAGLMNDSPRKLSPGTSYSIDLIGPLPLTLKQSRFALVMVDVCTKFLVVKPLKIAQ